MTTTNSHRFNISPLFSMQQSDSKTPSSYELVDTITGYHYNFKYLLTCYTKASQLHQRTINEGVK